MMCKRILLIVLLGMTSACVRHADIRAPEVTRAERFAYTQDDQGRWIVVARTTKDLDEAMKHIHLGPASVEKVDLWIVTPLGPVER